MSRKQEEEQQTLVGTQVSSHKRLDWEAAVQSQDVNSEISVTCWLYAGIARRRERKVKGDTEISGRTNMIDAVVIC